MGDSPANAPVSLPELVGRLVREPNNPAAFDEVMRAAGEPGALDSLVIQLEEAAAVQGNTPAAVPLWALVARVAYQAMDRPDRAEAALNRALSLSPDHPRLMVALADVLEKLGRFPQLAVLLERVVAVAPDAPSKAAALERLGRIQDARLSAPDKALVSLMAAFRTDRSRLGALRYARLVHIRSGREELAKQLVDLEVAALSPDPGAAEAVPRLAEEYASLAEALLSRPELHAVARDAAERALRLVPGHPKASAVARGLEEFSQQWPEHVRRLREEALSTRDKRVAAARYLSVAQVYHDYGKDNAHAVEFLDRCLLLTPGHRPALKLLEQLHREAGTLDVLVARLGDLASSAKDPQVAIEIHLATAVVLAESQAPRERLAQAYAAVVKLDPANKSATNALLENALEGQDFAGAVAVLDHYAAAARQPAERRWALSAAARLLDLELGDVGGAIARHEQALAVEPRDREALENLERLYGRAGRPADYVRVLEVMCEQAPNNTERLRCLDLLSAAYAQQLKLVDRSFETQRQAFALDPRPTRAGELMKLAEQLGKRADLAQTICDVGAWMSQPGEKCGMLTLAARLFAAGGEPRRARETVEAVLAVDANHRGALEVLAALSAQGTDARDIVATLQKRLTPATPPADRRAILVQQARLYADELKEVESAARCWREILEMAPSDGEALASLDELLRQAERWDELAGVLRARVAQAGTAPEGAPLRVRLARLCEERLNLPDEAVEHYVALHQQQPDSPEPLAALERLVARGVQSARIASVLEAYYARAGASRRQAEMLEVRRQAASDPAERLALARQAARALEEQRNPRDAFLALAHALQECPADAQVPAELERLAHVTKLHAELCDAFRVAAGGLPAGPARLGLLSRRAAVLGDVLGRDQEAITAHQEILHDHPRERASWEALARLHEARQEWPQVAEALQAAADLADGAEKASHLKHLGEVLLERQGDPARAAGAFELVRNHPEPAARGAVLAALDTCYGKLGQARELLGVLVDRAALAAGPAQAELWARAAELLAGSLGQAEQAVQALERAVQVDAGNARARGLLEGLLQAAGESQFKLTVARLLDQVYAAQADAQGSTKVLQARLDAAATPDERRPLVLALATAHARDLQAPDAAADVLADHLVRDPGDETARQELENIVKLAGRPERLVAAYQAVAQAHAGPVAVAYGRRVGACHERAGDRDASLAAYRLVLVAAPQDVEALAAVVRLRRQVKEPRALAEALEAHAAAESGADRASLLREAASLWHRQGDLALALEDLHGAVEALPGDVTALRMRVQILEQVEDPAALANAVQALAAVVPDPERSTFLVRLGRIRHDRLHDPAGAVEALFPVLAGQPADLALAEAVEVLEALTRLEGPHHASAVAALSAHYAERKAPTPLVALLDRHASMTSVAAERARLLDEVSRLSEVELGQRDAALGAACRAFREEPTDARQARVEALAGATRAFDAYVAVLEEVAEGLASRDPLAAAAKWRDVARVGADLLKDRAVAIRAYHQVLKHCPGDGAAIAALESLHRGASETGALVEVLRAKAAAASSPADRREPLLQAAKLLSDAGDLAGAEGVYRQLRVDHPDDVAVLDLLDALHTRSGNAQALAEVLVERAACEPGPGKRALLLARLGRLHLQRPDGLPVALEVLTRAAQDHPACADVATALSDLMELGRATPGAPVKEVARVLEACLRARKDVGALPAVLEARLVGEQDHAARAAVLRELAVVHEQHLSQPAQAFMAASRAVRETPEDEPTRAHAERLAELSGAWDELVGAYEDVMGQGADPALRALLHRRIALICTTHVRDEAQAVLHLRAALQDEPGDLPTLDELARLTRPAGPGAELVEVLRQLANALLLKGDAAQARAVLLELADAQVALGDVPAAIDLHRQALKLDQADRQVLNRLDGLLENANRFEELAEVLVTEAELAGQPADAAAFNVRLAQVMHKGLGDPVGAVDALGVAAKLDADNPHLVPALEAVLADLSTRSGEEVVKARAGVADLLTPRYEASSDARRLCDVLEVKLETVEDKAGRTALWRRIAALQEGPLGRLELAYGALGRALKESPDDDGLRGDLERLAQAAGDLETLVGLYLDIAETAPAGPTPMFYRRRLAAILEASLQQPERAAEQLELARQLLGPPEGDAAEARALRSKLLQGLERLYRVTGKPTALAEVLRNRAGMEQDPRVVRTLLMEVANLEAAATGAGDAVGTLNKLMELNPQDLEVLRNLQAACEAQQRWPDLVDALLREAELCAAQLPDRELEARFKAATVMDAALGRSPDANRELGVVVNRAPGHGPARAYLEERLRRIPTQREATAALLRHAYLGTGEWKKAVDVLEVLCTDAEAAGNRERLKALLVEMAELNIKRLNLPGPAFGALCRAVAADRSDVATRERLVEVGRNLGTLEEVAEVLAEEAGRAEQEGGHQAAAEMRETAAAIFAQDMQNSDRAAELYELVLQRVPGRPQALEPLQALYKAAGRWNDVETTLRKQLAVTSEPAQRAPLLHALGVVLGTQLHAPDEAQDALEEAFRLDGTRADTRLALVDLYAKGKQFDRAHALLEQELAFRQGTNDQPGTLNAMRKLGALLAGPLQRPQDALPYFKALFGALPEDRQVFDALESLLRKQTLWNDLKTLYEVQLAREKDGARQQDLSGRLAMVLSENLGDDTAAIQKFTKVLELNPRDVSAMDALRRIYRKAQRWDDMVGILRRLRRVHTEPSDVKAVQFDLAEAMHAQGKAAESVEAARRALDLEPHTDQELKRAHEIFAANKAYEEAANALERRVQVADTAERQAEVLLALGELCEGPLDRPDRAGAAYERVLELFPADATAHAAAVRMYEKAEDWQKVVSAKEGRVGHAQDHQEKATLLAEIAALYEQRLDQKDLAFLAACRAFRERPGDADLVATMERLAAETDSLDEMSGVLEDAVPNVEDTDRAIELYLKLAELCADKLGRPDEAEQHLKMVFDLEPENGPALDALERLYQGQERWPDAVRVLERRLQGTSDLERKKGFLVRMATMQEDKQRSPADAINTYKRLLEMDPKDARALDGLSNLYQQTNKWGALNSMLTHALELATTTAERVPLRYRVASIQEQQFQDAQKAMGSYREILQEDPGHVASLTALERLYASHQMWEELYGIHERQLALAEETADRVAILDKMVALQWEQFRAPDQAVILVDSILEMEPANLGAIQKLEKLFKETQNAPRLVGALERHIQVCQDESERLELRLEAADVHSIELGAPDKAEAVLKEALAEDPRSTRVIDALARVYERAGNSRSALERLAQLGELLRGKREAVDVYYRMGNINADMVHDSTAARANYEAALKLDPTHLPSLQALKAIHFAGKDFGGYLRRLVEEAEATEDLDQKAELFTAAGQHVQEREGDLDGAVRYYERALQTRPDHLGAAKPLADIEFRREGYAKAEALLEIVIQKLDPEREAREMCRQHYRLGYITEKLGDNQKALQNYQRALDLDPDYLPALEGLGTALIRVERWEDANRVYLTIINGHRDSLTDAEVVDYYYRLAEIGDKLGPPDRAVRNLEKALELDSNHAPSLTLLAISQEKAGNYEESYEALMRLASLIPGEEKSLLLAQIGQLSQEKLNDPYRAIDAYEEANQLRKDDKVTLTALLGLYRETKQGQKAVAMLEDLIRLEEDEAARVRFNFQLGEVWRDEMKNDVRAVQYFNAALDLDWNHLRSFESIERLLTEKKAWKGLEENYRAMIQRLPKEQLQIRKTMWRNLAQLYQKVLKDLDNAAMAYSVLSKLDTENLEVLETLAELQAKRPGNEDEAIRIYQSLLPKAQNPTPALHSLTRLYMVRKNPDRAWCIVQALRILKEIQDDETNLHNKLNQMVPSRAQRSLTDKLWETHVTHERARIPMAVIAATLTKLAPAFLRPSKDFVGKKKEFERLEWMQSLVFSAKQLAGVNTIFAGAPFELYKQKNSDAPPTLLPVLPLTIIVGEHNTLFKEVPARVLWAMWGRVISFLRPAFLIPRMLGPEDFRRVVEAALFVNDTAARYRTDPRELEKVAATFLKLEGAAQVLGTLKGVVSRKEPPAVEQLYEGMEHTAVRASLLACNDVDIAIQVMKVADPQSPPVPKNRMRELVLYLVSDEYADLRNRLALSIK